MSDDGSFKRIFETSSQRSNTSSKLPCYRDSRIDGKVFRRAQTTDRCGAERPNSSRLAANAVERTIAGNHHGITPTKLVTTAKPVSCDRRAKSFGYRDVQFIRDPTSSKKGGKPREQHDHVIPRRVASKTSRPSDGSPAFREACRIRPPAAAIDSQVRCPQLKVWGTRTASNPPISRKVCFHTAPQPAQKLEISPRIF